MKSTTARPPLPIILDSDIDNTAPAPRGFGGSTAPERAAHGEILQRAYSIWECAGRPENCELAHWLEAESEVLAEA